MTYNPSFGNLFTVYLMAFHTLLCVYPKVLLVRHMCFLRLIA